MKLLLQLGALVVLLKVVSSNTPAPDTLRLAGTGATSKSGRLEIYHDGVWGTVCDDVFTDVDAQVACFELGFGYQGRVWPIGDSYGDGTGTIWLDEVACTGTETTLASCPHNTWGVHDCAHSEDVAIECGEPETTTAYVPTTIAPVNIQRSLIEMSLDARAAPSQTLSCLSQFSTQFRNKLKAELDVVRQQLQSPTFCPGITQSLLSVAYVNLGNNQPTSDVSLKYGVYLTTKGGDTMGDLEFCSGRITTFLSSFSNWNQPIWSPISGCPDLAFTSTQFTEYDPVWVCPAAAYL